MTRAIRRLQVTLLHGLAMLLLLGGSAAVRAQDAPAAPAPAEAAAPEAAPGTSAPPEAAPGTSAPPEAAPAPVGAGREGCLSCHRFPGLGRIDHDSGELRLFFTSERYYADAEGPHARLECTQCHAPAEVGRIPHDEVSPVDCSQACHLVSSAGAPVRFSHDAVAERVEGSVHQATAMAALPFAQAPLRPGQSACLYCHDEPVFAEGDTQDRTHRGMAATTRCATCHDQDLAVDVEYFIKHTAGRLESARPVVQGAQACATCHSDPALAGEMELHDSVSSYFRSFHGKASLLGSSETASCVDCHSSETGDVHVMLAKTDARAPTHEDNVAMTCRTARCHPDASPELSSAAVHLRVDPQDRNLEFYVLAAFILLTFGVMTVYFALVLLELLNAVVRRHSEDERRMVALARAVMADPRGAARLQRLTPHERFQHWALAILFILLVLTGMPLKFATNDSVQAIAQALGGVANTRWLHRAAGVLLCLTFVYHLGYLGRAFVADLRRRRAASPERPTLKLLWDVVLASPMMVTPTDLKQFGQLFAYLVGLRSHRPPHGRFHFSQKFEYWAVFWGMLVIGSSGIVLWTASWVSEYLGGRPLNFAFIVHSDEAFLALIYIAVVHFFAVVFSPSVFPLNLGSLTGQMPVVEIAEAHSGHLLATARELGITAPEEPEEPHPGLLPQLLRRTYALVLFVGLALLAWRSLGYLLHELSGPTPVIAVESLPIRLDEEALVSMGEGRQTGAGGARRDRAQRGPLAHFHVIPSWFAPDPGNTCAGAGCHAALPHGERKEDRAWLNMHSTFVDCAVCHLQAPPEKSALRWVSLDEARAERPSPALMRLAAALAEPLATEAEAPEAQSAALEAQSAALEALLDQAIVESGQDPELVRWKLQLDTSRPGRPMHALYIEEMRRRIHLHGHGEFGAKIGLPGSDARRFEATGEVRTAAEALRAGGASLADEERRRLIAQSHPGLARPEVQCTRCHADQPEAIDFEGLGYSGERARGLRSNTIVRQSEAVERGEVFYIPALLQPPAALVPSELPAPEGAAAPGEPR